MTNSLQKHFSPQDNSRTLSIKAQMTVSLHRYHSHAHGNVLRVGRGDFNQVRSRIHLGGGSQYIPASGQHAETCCRCWTGGQDRRYWCALNHVVAVVDGKDNAGLEAVCGLVATCGMQFLSSVHVLQAGCHTAFQCSVHIAQIFDVTL